MNTRLFTFAGGETGVWRVVRMDAVAGAPLPGIPRLDVAAGSVSPQPLGTKWLLRGITSNERYVVREEKDRLVAKQPSLGRAEATCAALIPIRKNPSWGTVAKLAMRQPFVLFKGLTFQKLCLPGAFRPGDHHNKMLRPGLCVVHASPQYL